MTKKASTPPETNQEGNPTLQDAQNLTGDGPVIEPDQGTPTEPPAGSADPILTIEQHTLQLQLQGWQYKGVKTRNDWPVGKKMKRSTFQAALSAWLKGTPLKDAEPETPAEPSQSETKEA